jgi:hypothetical protein
LPLQRLRTKPIGEGGGGGGGGSSARSQKEGEEGGAYRSSNSGPSAIAVFAPNLPIFKQFELESDGRADDAHEVGNDKGEQLEDEEGGGGDNDDNDKNGGPRGLGAGLAATVVKADEGDERKEANRDDEMEKQEAGDQHGNVDDEEKNLAVGDDPIGGRAAAEAEEKRKNYLKPEIKNLMLEEQDDASKKEGDGGTNDENSRNERNEKGSNVDNRKQSEERQDPKPHIELDWSLAVASRRNVSVFPNPESHDVISVLILPQLPEHKRKANSQHLIYDGVRESPLLNFTDDVNNTANNVVWVLDLLPAREVWVTSESDTTAWCRHFASIIEAAQHVRMARRQPLDWAISIVDNRDYPIISTCVEIGTLVGDHNVRYSYRSAIKLRAWSERVPWVRVGKLLDRDSFPRKSRYEYKHRPIGVRTDTVEAVQSVAQESYGLKLCHPIEELNRTIDVSYFWEFQNFTRSHASLRDTVYLLLQDLQRNRSDWNMVVGPRGDMARRGRKQVSNEYIETLLDSKIVVVAQRDKWEDHYRLFEAIVAGAFVLTDRMLSLPRGLKAGVSVVEYNDADDLRSKLDYYLRNRQERVEIARRARFVAMSNHRSWHHMEEVVFGSPVTRCSEATGSACPYIVHANQIKESC